MRKTKVRLALFSESSKVLFLLFRVSQISTREFPENFISTGTEWSKFSPKSIEYSLQKMILKIPLLLFSLAIIRQFPRSNVVNLHRHDVLNNTKQFVLNNFSFRHWLQLYVENYSNNSLRYISFDWIPRQFIWCMQFYSTYVARTLFVKKISI